MRSGTTADCRASLTAQINTFTLWNSQFLLVCFQKKFIFDRPCDVEKTADPSWVTAMPVTALHVQQNSSITPKLSPSRRVSPDPFRSRSLCSGLFSFDQKSKKLHFHLSSASRGPQSSSGSS